MGRKKTKWRDNATRREKELRDYDRPPKCFRIMWYKKRKRWEARSSSKSRMDLKRGLMETLTSTRNAVFRKEFRAWYLSFFCMYKLHGCCSAARTISRSQRAICRRDSVIIVSSSVRFHVQIFLIVSKISTIYSVNISLYLKN